MRDNPAETPEARAELDAVIVGARFSGIDMPHRLRGLRLSVRVGLRGLQRCGWHLGVESTLARCDVEIMDYSYSFSTELEQEWEWTDALATVAKLDQH